MDLEQVKQNESSVAELKSLSVGSLNNLSDSGSGRIFADEGRSAGSWALMSMVKSVSVVACSEQSAGCVQICNLNQLTGKAMDFVEGIANGFGSGIAPERAEEGFGGTYFVSDSNGNKVAIFKPCDEEPLAPCNPKGFVGRSLGDPGLKPTIRVGEAALREVAAYLLDRGQFAQVPTTLLMRASHPVFNYVPGVDSSGSLDLSFAGGPSSVDASKLPVKLGSIQEFVTHFCDTTEMGTSKFTTSDVQRIAILDIRLYNTDRHAGNILVRKVDASKSLEPFKETGFQLIPIDHGFCLPEALEPPYFEWQHWSQARMPLGKEELEYIAAIDIEAEKALLRKELPVLREESLRTMEVSTTLLKKCAAAGLSLHEIAGIMTRPLVGMDEEKSDLEKLCLETKDEVMSAAIAGLEISWISSDYESDDLESNETTTATPTRIDELQFCIDDLKLETSIKNVTSSNGLANDAATETVVALFEQGLEECLERLSLECEGNPNADPIFINLGLKHGHRSMSMALPASSVCCRAPKRGERARRGHHPDEGPQKGDQKVAYPPLVHGSAPGSSDDVFRHMSSEQWGCFMELLCDKIDDGIRRGKWVSHDIKKRSMSMNLGISCPRF